MESLAVFVTFIVFSIPIGGIAGYALTYVQRTWAQVLAVVLIVLPVLFSYVMLFNVNSTGSRVIGVAGFALSGLTVRRVIKYFRGDFNPVAVED